jgi:hypothetical protein
MVQLGPVIAQDARCGGMPFEIASAIVGNAIAGIVSKLAPARRAGEFAGMPFERLQRRNRWLYRGLLTIAVSGFVAPYLFFTPGKFGLWFAGAIFGLPFSGMLAYMIVIWCALGSRRARELLFYFEAKQKTNIHVFYVLGAPLSLLGVISLLVLWR